MAAPDEGAGATITLGTTNCTLLCTSIQGQGLAWSAIDISHLATTAAKVYKRGDLYDPGTITCEVLWDPNIADTLRNSSASETITITYPITTNTAPTEASTGFVQSFDSGRCELDAPMTGSVTIKRSGAITFTDGT